SACSCRGPDARARRPFPDAVRLAHAPASAVCGIRRAGRAGRAARRRRQAHRAPRGPAQRHRAPRRRAAGRAHHRRAHVRPRGRLGCPNHPYGRPVEGTIESVGKLTRDDVARFHGANVRPDTTIITVVGAITVDDARREVLARFGGWSPPAETPASVPPAAAGGPPQSETIEKDLTQATILLGRQAIRQTDPDYFPLAVASYVLG